jgi:riboflavin kinase/FMN adenylyltransferase
MTGPENFPTVVPMSVTGRRVLTVGNFDGVHRGHQQIFRQVQDMARRLQAEPLVITFSPHAASVLRPGHRAGVLTLPEEKRYLINRLGIPSVHFQPFDRRLSELSPEEFWEQIILRQFNPAGVVSGYHHRFGRGQEGSPETLARLCGARGIEYLIVEACHAEGSAISSTRIRQLIREGSLEAANHLLGHPYLLEGLVVHGDGLGRTMGAPTANLEFSAADKLLPPDGVYACRVANGAEWLPASLYVGSRPTLGHPGPVRAEVHLLQGNPDLYGRTIRLELDEWMRSSRQFAETASLQDQIKKDIVQIEEYYKNKLPQKG